MQFAKIVGIVLVVMAGATDARALWFGNFDAAKFGFNKNSKAPVDQKKPGH
ncbi:hypothetical protein TWF694_004069 [Orbilia ellipsospora]|uniref:Uncharacterized protein n=1 Tax=Orbilia ellipsospora TaxID=2528407 RepID=A0AAV9WY90_9PEZI